ncbi:ATP12 family chaperone protein [Micavibrio aeruginosavorus]|uniref:ATP12 family chaperone protein n=1 Tax=Micavibrio aeruginosavorus TaxID=349221 RepID=UPI003F4A873E
MKRFYKVVTSQAEPAGGFSIRLDGKPVKTPSGQMVVAPTPALADGLVQEWSAQVDNIVPDTMPLTQVLVTAIDRVAGERKTMTDMVAGYLDTDLLCYQTEEPPELAAQQNAAWAPARDWFARVSGAALVVTPGLSAIRQPDAAHKYVRRAMEGMNLYQFTVFQLVTVVSGSVVLGLAFMEGVVTPDDVFIAANVEDLYRAEIYNEALYGPAPHQEKQRATMRADLNASRDFLDRLKP